MYRVGPLFNRARNWYYLSDGLSYELWALRRMMRIIDISQEVFSCNVFPGDPAPEKVTLMKKSEGDVCNLSAFNMCAHNGTHVDAPFHFINDGETIDQIDLERFVGYAFVSAHDGPLTGADAEEGVYLLNAAPLNLGGSDGAPCRAVLIDMGDNNS